MALKCGKNKSDPPELVSGGGEANTPAEAMTKAAHNFLKSLANVSNYENRKPKRDVL
jgi:hypothetical protein